MTTTTSSSTTMEQPTSTGDGSGTMSASDSNATTTTATTDASSSTATTGPSPACGDGTVDDGEECDDSNQENNDACTNACKNNICGDGFLGPGEACDDGNQIDDDTCGNNCTSAQCGDGKVQAPEECDDGNPDDTDTCLTTCLNAICGDAAVQAGVEECDDGNADDTDDCVTGCKSATCGDTFVQAGTEECDDGNADDTDSCIAGCKDATCGDTFIQAGVEECDDGNMSNADMCTTMCKAPTCMDMIKDGSETDVDCGGGVCMKCGVGKACGKGSDCGTGYCAMNLCVVAPSCKAIKTADPMAANGVYPLDPDGNGPIAGFNAFCEMTIDGGGWTLALKADGSKNTFLYDDFRWTDNSLFQTNFPDLDRNEAKLSTWNTIAFTDVLIGMEQPIGNMGPLVLKTQKITITRPSLFALFSPNTYVATTIGRNAWKALITGSSLQPNCNREGFNSAPAGNTWPRSRIGIVSNQEADCNSPDSYLGIGNQQPGCGQPETRVGNMASCTPDNGDKSLQAFGVVFVR